MTVKWINPLTNEEDVLIVERPFVDVIYWYHVIDCRNDTEICTVLNNILKELDCTREYSCGRPMMTYLSNYKITISNYYYYLLKLNNQFLYNNYINYLINRHIKNILFEYEHPYSPTKIVKKKRNSKKRIIEDKFIKQETIDMFTGNKKYFYINAKTGEQFESSNPNLVDELKQRKKKEKVSKRGAVPISAMTFSFKKKN